MNRKTKKLLGLGVAAAAIWYFYNKQQQLTLAQVNAARAAAGQIPAGPLPGQ